MKIKGDIAHANALSQQASASYWASTSPTFSTGDTSSNSNSASIEPLSVSSGLSRERAEGQRGDLDSYLNTLQQTYDIPEGPGASGGGDNGAGVEAGGGPGKGNKGKGNGQGNGQSAENAAKNAEAQAQITENKQHSSEASKLGGESAKELQGLAAEAQAIQNGPLAGPKGEMPQQLERQLEERQDQIGAAEIGPMNLDGERRRPKPEELPKVERGQTQRRLEVEAGEGGKEQIKQELTEQTRVGQLNQDGQARNEQLKPEFEQGQRELTDAQDKTRNESTEEKRTLQTSQETATTDAKSVTDTDEKKSQTQEEVSRDQEQVQADQAIIETDNAHVSRATQDVSSADRESEEAAQMKGEADKSVQEAQQLKPGNGQGGGGAGGGKANGKGGGGEIAASNGGGGEVATSGGGGAKGKGNAGGGGGAAGPGNSNGNGNGVVWRRALASAQDFQKKAVARQGIAQQRQMSAQQNLDSANQKLEQDRAGLERSQEHLRQSQQNLSTVSADNDAARRNLESSQKQIQVSTEKLDKFQIRTDDLNTKLTVNQQSRQHLENSALPLRESVDAGRENVEKLKSEQESSPSGRVVELRELKPGETTFAQLNSGPQLNTSSDRGQVAPLS